MNLRLTPKSCVRWKLVMAICNQPFTSEVKSTFIGPGLRKNSVSFVYKPFHTIFFELYNKKYLPNMSVFQCLLVYLFSLPYSLLHLYLRWVALLRNTVLWYLSTAMWHLKDIQVESYLFSLSGSHESKNNECWNGPPKKSIVTVFDFVRPYLLPEETKKEDR